MTVASNMRVFTVAAIGTFLRFLVIFQFATGAAVWTSDIQIHSEVKSENPGSPNVEDTVNLSEGKLAAAPQYQWFKRYQPEATSNQPQRSSPLILAYSKPTQPELPTNTIYHSNRIEFLPFPPAFPPLFPAPAYPPPIPTVQQIYQQALQTLQPHFQQQFQHLVKEFFPPQPQQPWIGYGQSPQAPQYAPWQQPQYHQPKYPPQFSPGPKYPPQYPAWPLNPPQHQTVPKYNPQHPQVHQHPQYTVPPPQQIPQKPQQVQYLEDFQRQYSNPELTNHNAQELMGKLDKLIDAVRPIDRPLPEDLRFQLFQQAALLLSRMASLAVVLISQRNNSDMDKRVDDFLHKMEDKSYQLKTMLIEMQSFASENIAVATPPRNLPNQPFTSWSPEGSYPFISPVGRELDGLEKPEGSLGNLDR